MFQNLEHLAKLCIRGAIALETLRLKEIPNKEHMQCGREARDIIRDLLERVMDHAEFEHEGDLLIHDLLFPDFKGIRNRGDIINAYTEIDERVEKLRRELPADALETLTSGELETVKQVLLRAHDICMRWYSLAFRTSPEQVQGILLDHRLFPLVGKQTQEDALRDAL